MTTSATSPGCDGHLNGFDHLTLTSRPDLESRFDVGYKFEERESSEFAIDPMTGIKAWAEPELVLLASVSDRDSHQKRQQTQLRLTRSRWSDGWGERGSHSTEDEGMLLRILHDQLPLLLDQLATRTLDRIPDELPVA